MEVISDLVFDSLLSIYKGYDYLKFQRQTKLRSSPVAIN